MRGGVEERKREGVGPREGKRERGEMGRGREGKREGWWKGERKKREVGGMEVGREGGREEEKGGGMEGGREGERGGGRGM